MCLRIVLLIVLLFAVTVYSELLVQQKVTIGVLALRGKDQCIKQWESTATYLSSKIEGTTFSIIPLTFDEVCNKSKTDSLDFFLVNPAYYVRLERSRGVLRIATMVNKDNSEQISQFGGVIFTRHNRDDIQTIQDIKKKSFMAVSSGSFGGWYAAKREFLERGIVPEDHFSSILFGQSHDSVVHAIFKGTVDAGTIRTGILEAMEKEGIYDTDSFKIINAQDSHFPFAHSTKLYPEWPFAASSKTDNELAKKVVIALLAIPDTAEALKTAQIAGWTIPGNYNEVANCLKSVKAPPFEHWGEISVRALFIQYGIWVILFLVFSVLLLLYSGVRLVKKIRKSSNENRKLQGISWEYLLYSSASFMTGSFVLMLFSALQKIMAGYSLKPKGFTIPFIFGGVAGFIIGTLFSYQIRQKNRISRQLEELRTGKELLHNSAKMEAIGQLASGVAHDFNNALGAIMGAVELLKTDTLSKDEQREYFELILTAGGRAADLTKKLLLFARKGNKASSTVNCAKIVEDTVALLKHTINKNITVSVENRAIQTSVIGDDSLLQNAIMNMGINASHAMPDGGVLTFTLENLELDAEYCSVSPFEIIPGEYLEISIRDTGTGMPPEILSRIFEPFFTTKEAGKGTGLGMAAVYGTVQEHNGAITVYSEVGAGTVFHVYLPVTAETVRREITSEPKGTGSGTILVIDDEELIRITASAMLRSLGYKVILATNGLEGVKTFLETKDEINLIILDMIMPIMGGREAFAKLREIDPTIPIVIASGFAKEEDMAALKTQGANGFLNKPFRRAELAEMVGTAMTRMR